MVTRLHITKIHRNDGVLVYLKIPNHTCEMIKLGESISLQINISGDDDMTLTTRYRPPKTCVRNFSSDRYAYLESMQHVETHMMIR